MALSVITLDRPMFSTKKCFVLCVMWPMYWPFNSFGNLIGGKPLSENTGASCRRSLLRSINGVTTCCVTHVCTGSCSAIPYPLLMLVELDGQLPILSYQRQKFHLLSRLLWVKAAANANNAEQLFLAQHHARSCLTLDTVRDARHVNVGIAG